jgi:predicted  nucleic acid-binding Zn-ribbon protein
MFRCVRCGSRYSAKHAAAMENCPRCIVRDRTPSALTFEAFQQLTNRSDTEAEMGSSLRDSQGRDQPLSV